MSRSNPPSANPASTPNTPQPNPTRTPTLRFPNPARIQNPLFPSSSSHSSTNTAPTSRNARRSSSTTNPNPSQIPYNPSSNVPLRTESPSASQNESDESSLTSLEDEAEAPGSGGGGGGRGRAGPAASSNPGQSEERNPAVSRLRAQQGNPEGQLQVPVVRSSRRSMESESSLMRNGRGAQGSRNVLGSTRSFGEGMGMGLRGPTNPSGSGAGSGSRLEVDENMEMEMDLTMAIGAGMGIGQNGGGPSGSGMGIGGSQMAYDEGTEPLTSPSVRASRTRQLMNSGSTENTGQGMGLEIRRRGIGEVTKSMLNVGGYGNVNEPTLLDDNLLEPSQASSSGYIISHNVKRLLNLKKKNKLVLEVPAYLSDRILIERENMADVFKKMRSRGWSIQASYAGIGYTLLDVLRTFSVELQQIPQYYVLETFPQLQHLSTGSMSVADDLFGQVADCISAFNAAMAEIKRDKGIEMGQGIATGRLLLELRQMATSCFRLNGYPNTYRIRPVPHPLQNASPRFFTATGANAAMTGFSNMVLLPQPALGPTLSANLATPTHQHQRNLLSPRTPTNRPISRSTPAGNVSYGSALATPTSFNMGEYLNETALERMLGMEKTSGSMSGSGGIAFGASEASGGKGSNGVEEVERNSISGSNGSGRLAGLGGTTQTSRKDWGDPSGPFNGAGGFDGGTYLAAQGNMNPIGQPFAHTHASSSGPPPSASSSAEPGLYPFPQSSPSDRFGDPDQLFG